MRVNKIELCHLSILLSLINKHYTEIISDIQLYREEHFGSEEIIIVEIKTYKDLNKVRESRKEFLEDWIRLSSLIREKFIVLIQFGY